MSKTSLSRFFRPIQDFHATNGLLSKPPIISFLSNDEQKIVGESKDFRISLYKILLFQTMVDGIRSGKLNLQYSYRYRAIQDYLIPTGQWDEQREQTVKSYGPF